jgi:hypothetical protein
VDADLLYARPDTRHRLPIVRLQAALHSPELESGDLPGGVWEAPDPLSRESPSQISCFWAMAQYTRTWMLRQSPVAS